MYFTMTIRIPGSAGRRWECWRWEMEACALYLNAARMGAKALAMMTISDNFVTGQRLTVEEREKGFSDMIRGRRWG